MKVLEGRTRGMGTSSEVWLNAGEDDHSSGLTWSSSSSLEKGRRHWWRFPKRPLGIYVWYGNDSSSPHRLSLSDILGSLKFLNKGIFGEEGSRETDTLLTSPLAIYLIFKYRIIYQYMYVNICNLSTLKKTRERIGRSCKDNYEGDERIRPFIPV